ncbi:MAG: hypothetical protein MZV63_02755 [Marinilabiliales bacterium]|nr:hypothetical protein [Marinilabiliales bacterium]
MTAAAVTAVIHCQSDSRRGSIREERLQISGMTDLSLKARSLLEADYETGLTPPSSEAAVS